MGGSVAGGRKAAIAIKSKYGDDFFPKIGAIGGKKGKGPDYSGGFADGEAGKERARRAGAIGGKRSSRKNSPNKAVIVKDEETEMTPTELHELFGTQEPELTHPKLFNIRRFF